MKNLTETTLFDYFLIYQKGRFVSLSIFFTSLCLLFYLVACGDLQEEACPEGMYMGFEEGQLERIRELEEELSYWDTDPEKMPTINYNRRCIPLLESELDFETAKPKTEPSREKNKEAPNETPQSSDEEGLDEDSLDEDSPYIETVFHGKHVDKDIFGHHVYSGDEVILEVTSIVEIENIVSAVYEKVIKSTWIERVDNKFASFDKKYFGSCTVLQRDFQGTKSIPVVDLKSFQYIPFMYIKIGESQYPLDRVKYDGSLLKASFVVKEEMLHSSNDLYLSPVHEAGEIQVGFIGYVNCQRSEKVDPKLEDDISSTLIPYGKQRKLTLNLKVIRHQERGLNESQ